MLGCECIRPAFVFMNSLYDLSSERKHARYQYFLMRTCSPFTNVCHVLLFSSASAYILLAEEEATTIIQVEIQ